MHAFNLTPLFRSSVGFDHLASLLDDAMRSDKGSTYPPYNIELIADDKYRISMAVAGFRREEVTVQTERNALSITGKQVADATKKFLHQGIAARSFERKFQLADHVKVVKAAMADGVLHVDLEREVPEAMRPRQIQIEGEDVLNLETSKKKVLESV